MNCLRCDCIFLLRRLTRVHLFLTTIRNTTLTCVYKRKTHPPPTFNTRTHTRTYTVIVAGVVPMLDLIISLVGALCSSTIALIFPPFIQLIVMWPERGKNDRLKRTTSSNTRKESQPEHSYELYSCTNNDHHN